MLQVDNWPSGILSFPRKIQIQTINRCNYACPMCPYPILGTTKEVERIDWDLFVRLIDEVRQAKQKVKLCLMLQNEPLLDSRFVAFLDYAHRSENTISSISTVTNGSVLDGALLDTIMAYDRFHLTISVNATDRERYIRVHSRDLWEHIHDLLTCWQGHRQRVRVSFVLDSNSLDEGRAFQTYWRSKGYGTRFVPINARVNSMNVNARLHVLDEQYGHCHYPVDTLTVLADGSVILCCNDWQHSECFGNLHENTISKVWNSPTLVALRKAAIEGTLRDNSMCKNCDYPIRSSQRMRLEALVSNISSNVDGG